MAMNNITSVWYTEDVGWMESMDVAGVLQETGDANSTAHTRSQV